MTPRYTMFDGQKAVSLGDLDRFMDFLINEDGVKSSVSVDEAVSAVAFCFRGMRLRAQALSTLPFEIIRKTSSTEGKPADTEGSGDDVLDASDDYQNALGFWPDPVDTLWRIEESLTAWGRGYLFREQNRVINLGLKYLHPQSVELKQHPQTGEPLYFERIINGQPPKRLEIDEVLHFWHPDYQVELGPPKKSPVISALAAAGVSRNVDRFVEAFFGRGAIKAMLLAMEGNPTKEEKGRLLEWFESTVTGIRNAFRPGIINAKAVTPVIIGEGLESLTNETLTKEKREDIAVALGIPYSLLLSGSLAGLGSGGVADRDDILFYTKTVQPEAEFVARVLNDQLLHDLGYHLRWRFSDLDIYSEDEKERATAVKTYSDAGLPLGTAMFMLGAELPVEGDLPPQYQALNEEAREAKEQMMKLKEESTAKPPKQESDARERVVGKDEADKAADLDRWRRMAIRRFEEGHPEKALAFESASIDGTLRASICGALEECKSATDVAGVFAWAGYP